MEKIRIDTGKEIIEVQARRVTDWIGNDGVQSSTADVDGVLLEVVARDQCGAIYGHPADDA